MDIPLDAEVYCVDGRCGRSTCIVLDPRARAVTHVVVKDKTFPHTARLVPITLVVESSSYAVHVGCSRAELLRLDSFIERADVQLRPQDLGSPGLRLVVGTSSLVPDIASVVLEYERVPAGELALHRGAEVEADGGYVGRVQGLHIDQATGRITDLVLREGPWWRQTDVIIPAERVEGIDEEAIHLKTDRHRRGTGQAVPA